MNLLLGLPLGIFRMLGVILMTLLRFIPVLLLAAAAVFALRRARRSNRDAGTKAETPPPQPSRRSPSFTGKVVTVDYREVTEEDAGAEPTPPSAFGHKSGWVVIRSRDPQAVCAALGLRDCRPSGWVCGLAAVSARKWFLTPSLDGYVVAVGAGERPLPPETLASLSRRFSEVQTFVCDRERALYAWSLYRNGGCVRAYGISRGQLLLDEGELTPEEIALGFGRFPRKDGGSREGFPDEDAVLSIAAAWGIDPMLEGRDDPPSVGWLATPD